jgi:hypothetical protein
MMGSDLGQDHHAQGGSGAFSKIRCVGGGVFVADEKLFSPPDESRHLSTIPIIKHHVC